MFQCSSVLDMPYADNSFDVVLFLDVFEHISYAEQPIALVEIFRVLRRGGTLLASIPNLAHFNSRFRMAFLGQLDRADIETNQYLSAKIRSSFNRQCLKLNSSKELL